MPLEAGSQRSGGSKGLRCEGEPASRPAEAGGRLASACWGLRGKHRSGPAEPGGGPRLPSAQARLPASPPPQDLPPRSGLRGPPGGKVSPRADLSSGSKESIAQPRHSHGDVHGQKHRQPVLEGPRRDRSPRACSTGRPLREVVWRSLKELRVGLLRDSAVPRLRVRPREPQTGRTLIHAHAASQQHRRPRHRRVEAARAPITGRWTDGLCSAHHGKLFSRNTE